MDCHICNEDSPTVVVTNTDPSKVTNVGHDPVYTREEVSGRSPNRLGHESKRRSAQPGDSTNQRKGGKHEAW